VASVFFTLATMIGDSRFSQYGHRRLDMSRDEGFRIRGSIIETAPVMLDLSASEIKTLVRRIK
jgi:hypothetical protein